MTQPAHLPPLVISNNRLTGEIPSTICNVSYLQILDISNNSLSGKIPQCLGNVSHSLLVMNLQMNNFQGTIADTFEKNNLLETLAFNGNHLEGKLPKSFVNCTNLKVLDLGNNKINDSFPYWLEALSDLRILVLKYNRFHGPVGNHKNNAEVFSKLQILDLSHNEFTGLLPRNYFKKLNAMITGDEDKDVLQYLGLDYFTVYSQGFYFYGSYQDSIEVILKGLETALPKIPTIFTIIDLLSNKFQGEIPKVLGRLRFLRLLNLSHNSLTGHIPSALANLSTLESLDLSSKELTGQIPMQLTSLTFLAVLNLSQNLLTGPIPQGKQFSTFENNSYEGNLGLCGFPLSIKCSFDEPPPPIQPSIFQEDNDSLFASGFGWKTVLIGYGCGFLFGLAMGYVVFKRGKPNWLVRFLEGKNNVKKRRPNNQRPRQRRNCCI